MSYSLSLWGGYYNYIEIDSFSSNTTLAYSVLSDAPISTALMTLNQFNSFVNDPNATISNSLTYSNDTSVQNQATLAPGRYFLLFYAFYSDANIQFGFQVTPNTPFSYGALTTPLASGISTFGISNNSGVATPYEIKTNEIVGTANITSLQVNTPNAAQYGVNIDGATLQLNTMLVVNDGSQNQSVYWVQNVPDFQTNMSHVSFGDEIWNFTDQSGFLSNQTVTSTNSQNGGAVYPTGQGNGGGPYVYNYNGPNYTFNLPLNFALVDNVTLLPNTGVLVQLGYMLLANGTSTSTQINWFDNVTIVDPNAQSAYFFVSGNSATPIGLYYNAELVFAGEGNLEVAHFTQLNASLGLFYQNQSSPNGLLSSFPSYYSFSGNTGESADNLVVNYTNGIASIGTGANPNYAYLGNSTLNLNLQSLTTSATNSSSQTNSSSSQTTSATNSAASQITVSSTTTTSSVQSVTSRALRPTRIFFL